MNRIFQKKLNNVTPLNDETNKKWKTIFDLGKTDDSIIHNAYD